MGYVYVFKGIDTPLFKIGRTENHLESRRAYATKQINQDNRLREIHQQRDGQVDVFLWACVSTGNPPGLEYDLHNMFVEHWTGVGEWFSLPLMTSLALRVISNRPIQNDLFQW